jgi:hypothetical protein
VVGLVLLLAAAGAPAPGRELWRGEDGESSATLRTALKTSLLVPEGESPSAFWRARVGLDAAAGSAVTVEAAYEQRLRVASADSAAGGLAVVPAEAPASYRVRQLDEEIAGERGSYSWRHELDRASLALDLGRAEVVVGRQAIGWGRGVFFSAADIFAPFTPLEADREWRRGVDALRVDARLTDRYALDVVGALGESRDESALFARLRGHTGPVDGELIAGRRREDTMYAAALSAAVAGAAVCGELALFDTPEEFDTGLFGSRGPVAKAVLGASYMFDVGHGVPIWAEYHYSGFGSRDMAEAVERLQEPAYADRYVRGDTQILGRHAVALQGSYELNDAWALRLAWIGSPQDGSGVVTPSLTWTLSDSVSVSASAYIPHGRGADAAGLPRSEYGAAPLTAFLQVRLYD